MDCHAWYRLHGAKASRAWGLAVQCVACCGSSCGAGCPRASCMWSPCTYLHFSTTSWGGGSPQQHRVREAKLLPRCEAALSPFNKLSCTPECVSSWQGVSVAGTNSQTHGAVQSGTPLITRPRIVRSCCFYYSLLSALESRLWVDFGQCLTYPTCMPYSVAASMTKGLP
jgi:hypothetical protein